MEQIEIDWDNKENIKLAKDFFEFIIKTHMFNNDFKYNEDVFDVGEICIEYIGKLILK